MASNPPSSCCIRGVKHEGSHSGKLIKINGQDAYLSEPPADKRHDHVGILFISDVFGIWRNNQLIADQLAANGYVTIIPDLFNGDKLGLDIDAVHPGDFDLLAWLNAGRNGAGPHTTNEIDPVVADSIKYMKETFGLKKLGSVGYCLGAKYVVRYLKDSIDVGYIAHPSFVEDDELAAITGPLSIAAAETDPIFPVDKRHSSEMILEKTCQHYQINLFSGVSHGFACRGDSSTTTKRFAKEQAFAQAVKWFDTWLLDPNNTKTGREKR